MERHDPLVCNTVCGGPRGRRQQERFRCTRADYRGRWTTNPDPPIQIRVHYFGRPEIGVTRDNRRVLEADDPGEAHNVKARRLHRPAENWNDGCPKGWMLTEFTGSLMPYLRPRDAGRPNPRTAELTEFGWEALLFLEREQEKAVYELHEARRHHREQMRNAST